MGLQKNNDSMIYLVLRPTGKTRFPKSAGEADLAVPYFHSFIPKTAVLSFNAGFA
jgi:hypothetical protein